MFLQYNFFGYIMTEQIIAQLRCELSLYFIISQSIVLLHMRPAIRIIIIYMTF